jgi:hypothetical protein
LTISAPPKDQNGLTTPHDHPEITENDRLIRRIPEQWIVEGKAGGKRLSSAAFEPSSAGQDPYRGLSVDHETLILADGRDARAYVTNPQQPGSLVLTTKNFRDRQFLVGFDPIPGNDYHGQVWAAPTRGSGFTKSTKRALLREASWFVDIEGVSITED